VPQVPPSFSAKKVDGVRSYRLARQGETPTLAPKMVSVEAMTLIDYDPPLIRWRCAVGEGTYVRALARDLGERLGTGAHLAELRRESIGRFSVESAVTPADVTPDDLIDPVALLADLSRQEVGPPDVAALRQGRRVGATVEGDGPVALVANGELVAVAERRDGQWQPVVVLPAE
jgi:tRNA pseudouridine55 synthase